MATAEVNLDTTQYVLINAKRLPLLLQAHRDSVRIVLADTKPSRANTAFHILGADDPVFPINVVDTNVWVLAMTDKSSLIVTEASIPEKQQIVDKYTDASVEVNRFGRLTISDPIRICGTLFETGTKDTQQYREAVTGSGTVTQANGTLTLATGTTANSAALYHSIEKGRYIAGCNNSFKYLGYLNTAASANNERRIGVGAFATYTPAAADTPTDGFGFYISGTEFGIWYRSLTQNPTGIVRVPNGSFSTGKTFTPVAGQMVELEIEYSHDGAVFIINGELMHQQDATSVALADTMNFHTFAQNINSGGLAVNESFTTNVMTIFRYGQDVTTPLTRRITGIVTAVLKSGPGTLHKVINAIKVTGGTNVQLWDGVTAAAPSRQMLTVDSKNFQGALPLDAPFRDGLTIVTTDAGSDLSIIYE